MIINIKIAMVLCLSLMLWVGSASGDLNETDNQTGNDTDAIDDNISKELFYDAYPGGTDNIPPFKGAIGTEGYSDGSDGTKGNGNHNN
ncbi:MAG: hypothetical protein C5S40_01160 [ANME-2 cluster archaeon]|nr:hypothetical protein [ANME-2 cluster archaeon]